MAVVTSAVSLVPAQVLNPVAAAPGTSGLSAVGLGCKVAVPRRCLVPMPRMASLLAPRLRANQPVASPMPSLTLEVATGPAKADLLGSLLVRYAAYSSHVHAEVTFSTHTKIAFCADCDKAQAGVNRKPAMAL